MAINVEQAGRAVSFWTPVEYRVQAAHWHHRCIQWIDSYFYLKGPVAVVVPGMIHHQSTGVRFEEKNEALWLTLLKVISYVTVIIPAIMLCAKYTLRTIYPFHMCSRFVPDGAEETGAFVNDVLQQGVRVENEQTVYVNPTLLIEGDVAATFLNENSNIRTNFAEVMIDGKQTIIPVRGNKETGEYTQCEESAYSILLKMIKKDSRAINWVLGHPNQQQFEKKFFAFLLSPGKYGRIPICTLTTKNPKPLLSIVKYASENHITIDPEIIDDLFIQWAGGGNAELTELLLDLHPQAIQKTIGRPSFFSTAALNGSSTEVEILIKAMNDQHIPLTPSDIWLYKAYSNDCTFTKEEFSALHEEIRQKIYQVANNFMHQEFILKLHVFGMKENPLPLKKADLFSPNMDAIDVLYTAHGFLDNLRKEGSLFTEEEFQQIDANRFKYCYPSLSNLQTSNYIQTTAEHLGLNYIKVQKRIAVFMPKDKNKKQTIGICINPWKNHVGSNDLALYEEEITPIERRISKEEMLGLLDLLEHIGYHFMCNYLRMLMGKTCDGKEGLYFVKVTHHQINQNADYSRMELLTKFLAEEDHAWLKKEIAERQERFQQRERDPLELEQEKEQEKQIAIKHGFGVERRIEVPFAFGLGDAV